ncbi:MAG TPA: tRNA pseudouridine(55) synthase TruB [Spirochaetia bacterium]|nr:tRNA pseudouridine(55) synthase TruB [Spirochaetia bacterium]
MTEGIGRVHPGAGEGIILLDKPPGQTSFQALARIKRTVGTRRVGHAGTLDRFAEGLLVVLSGRMTRLSSLATGMEKEYIAAVTFGKQTDTLDPEGKVVAEGPVPQKDDLEAALPSLVGRIMQVPPAYSAVHVGGRRAYEAARSGEEVVLAPREVTIHSLSLVSFLPPVATVRVVCSKGTYIRSLARDLAARLSTCAFVLRLRRIRIGGFHVEEAKNPEDFDPARDLLPPAAFFDASPGLRRLRLREEYREKAGRGAPLEDSSFVDPPTSDGVFGAFTEQGELMAVLEKRGARYRYAAAFPSPATL